MLVCFVLGLIAGLITGLFVLRVRRFAKKGFRKLADVRVVRTSAETIVFVTIGKVSFSFGLTK